MAEHYPNVGHVVDKLDDTFIVHLDDTPLTFWEEILCYQKLIEVYYKKFCPPLFNL